MHRSFYRFVSGLSRCLHCNERWGHLRTSVIVLMTTRRRASCKYAEQLIPPQNKLALLVLLSSPLAVRIIKVGPATYTEPEVCTPMEAHRSNLFVQHP